MIPYYPLKDDKVKHGYNIITSWEHLVSEYTGLNILQVNDLDYIDYLIYRHDAFIWKMEQTEDGEKYLENAWRLEQTKPDRTSLRKNFSKGVK